MKRRDFLIAGLTGTASFTLSGLTMTPRRVAAATTVNVGLVAEGTFRTMTDGASIYMWQFRDLSGNGPGALPSGLVVREGDTVNVTISNALDRSINLVIPGALSGTPAVSAGGTRTYSFTAPAAGSYFYTDGVNGEIGLAMGLSGPLVVIPANGSNRLYNDGPDFSRQYTLTLNELDDRLNNAIHGGLTYDMSSYEPNYFFVNGLSHPNTTQDDDTRVVMNVGEDIALRFINTGCITSPMHSHGYHFNIATRNRKPETIMGDKDTVLVNVGECVDVILHCNQPGLFPLHTHFVPAITTNGVYAGGAMMMMAAS